MELLGQGMVSVGEDEKCSEADGGVAAQLRECA